MTKIVNSGAGNSIFDINGNAIDNSNYKPNINSGSARGKLNSQRLSDAELDNVRIEDAFLKLINLEVSKRTIVRSIDGSGGTYATYSNELFTFPGTNSDPHGFDNSDIGTPIKITGVSNDTLFVSKIISSTAFEAIMPGNKTSGTFSSSPSTIIHVMEGSVNDIIDKILKKDISTVFNETVLSNSRNTIKITKYAEAIRSNRWDSYSADWDNTALPLTSDITSATNIADDNAQNKATRITISNGGVQNNVQVG